MTKGRKAPPLPTPAIFARAILDGRRGGTYDALVWHGNPDAPRVAWDKARVIHTATPAPDGPPTLYGFPVIIDDTGTLPEDSLIVLDDATVRALAERIKERETE